MSNKVRIDMRAIYRVVTTYLGNCPKCGRGQEGHSPELADRVCWKCELEKIKEALIRKDIIITKIESDEPEGPYNIYVESRGKTYIIKAKYLEEVE